MGAISSSDQPAKCPKCGATADRIMPTTFASMARVKGLRERRPYHHSQVRDEEQKRTIARVKPKKTASRSSSDGKAKGKGK
jgi:hypothetical protein